MIATNSTLFLITFINAIIIVTADLEQVIKNNYKFYKADKECGLEGFLETKGIKFCRGCAFYEFQNKTEDVPRNSRIILIDKVG